MQQRRARNRDSGLPLTTSDLTSENLSYNSKSKRNKGQPKSSLLFFCMLLIAIIFGIGLFIKKTPGITTSANHISKIRNSSKPLSSKFPSLKYSLENSDIVLLYFAASWCPESTTASKTLEGLFSAPHSPLADKVLVPETGGYVDDHTENAIKNILSIVYISSDRTQDEMEAYTRSNWQSIPFVSSDRNGLKQHFRTCAKVEMQELEIDPRRFEIPTILVIDSVTEGIISYTGVEEITQYRDEVLDHWMGIRDLMRGLEGKYSVD